MASLTFLGAAQTVTGSRHLLTTDSGKRILIDAGLFQGRKELRERNWAPWTGGKLDAQGTFTIKARGGVIGTLRLLFRCRDVIHREGTGVGHDPTGEAGAVRDCHAMP